MSASRDMSEPQTERVAIASCCASQCSAAPQSFRCPCTSCPAHLQHTREIEVASMIAHGAALAQISHFPQLHGWTFRCCSSTSASTTQLHRDTAGAHAKLLSNSLCPKASSSNRCLVIEFQRQVLMDLERVLTDTKDHKRQLSILFSESSMLSLLWFSLRCT